MVEYRQVQPTEWRKVRAIALALIRGHRDGHITRKTYNHVQSLRSQSLDQEGNVVWTAWADDRLVGVIVYEEYGNRTSMMVVHRDYRGQGIAKGMLLPSAKHMGRFYSEIAVDNLSSLRAVFAVGMVAYDVFLRRGKITLRMRNGFDPST